MNDLGERIERLRKEKGLSRPAFCGDEEDLSVRQLARIEKGEFRPTLKTLEYIAERLDIPSYILMPDYKELPKRYQELKYFLLHHPDYGNKDSQEKKEAYFDEIFENFYENLPRDEQIAVDCLQAIEQVRATDNEQYGQGIVEDYLETLQCQLSFSAVDFLKLRLYFLYIGLREVNGKVLSKKDKETVKKLFKRICNYVEKVDIDNLFLVRDSLFAAVGCLEGMKELGMFKAAIERLNWITDRTRDFQKKPIISMIEWKCYIQSDFNQAQQKYQEARMLAQMLGNKQLLSSLENEWKKDVKKYI